MKNTQKTKQYKLIDIVTGKVKTTRQLTLKEKAIFNYAYALNQTGLKLV
jgi:hypothetical protein